MNIIIFQNNGVILGLATIIFTFAEIFIQNKILMQVLKIEKNKINKTYAWQAFFISLIRITLPFYISKILEIIIQLFIYKKYLQCDETFLLFVEFLNIIIFSSLELICVKMCQMYYSNLIFIIALCEMIFIQFGTYIILKKLELFIDFPSYLSDECKKQIIEILLISILVILANTICMVNYIYNIPTGIYIVNMVFMVIYYLVVIRNIVKIIELESKKTEIDELTGTNHRLKQSYDDISSFRHDMKNILQGFGRIYCY